MQDYRSSDKSAPQLASAGRDEMALGEDASTRDALIQKIAGRVLGRDAVTAEEILTLAADDNVLPETLIDNILPDVARNIGDAWCVDEISFADVTIGVARLQAMLRDIEPPVQHNRADLHDASTILLVVAEDTFHTLGALVLACQLRRKGLSVRLLLGATPTNIAEACATACFDAVFVSANVSDSLEKICKIVDSAKVALGLATPVVVGGTLLETVHDVISLTGADYTALTADEAINLCNLRTAPRHNTAMDR